MITAITNPSTSLILNLGLALVVLVGAFRINSGNSRSGIIIAFLQYFVMILNAMLGITKIFVMWSKGEASAHRVADVLSMPEDLVQMNMKNSLEKEINCSDDITPAHIEFRDVAFSYTGIGANLDHLSFKLMRGESLGILGETGAGKSTILKVVLIDGRDVRSFSYDELRSKFGVVFQNDFVMEGTVEDNIRFFRPIDDSTVISASEDAQAAEFIASRDEGLKAAVVVRGNNLSGGQKQRLLISRALTSRPEILLLDDASSALDYRTDARLRRALRNHYSDTTTVLVAQRVSSIRSCTHILVLSDGRPVGYGKVDFHTVYSCVILMIIFYLLSAVLTYLLNVVMIRLSKIISKQMCHDIFENMSKLPVSFYDKYQTGDIISIVTYDVDTVNQSLSSDLLQILQSIVTVTVSWQRRCRSEQI